MCVLEAAFSTPTFYCLAWVFYSTYLLNIVHDAFARMWVLLTLVPESSTHSLTALNYGAESHIPAPPHRALGKGKARKTSCEQPTHTHVRLMWVEPVMWCFGAGYRIFPRLDPAPPARVWLAKWTMQWGRSAQNGTAKGPYGLANYIC